MTLTLDTPPAVACPLSGAFLIEASAGTGKTWTLTGILLRLLIEKNVRPERIVATTFTRAATQEMQERLHGRLVDFYDVCVWTKQHQASFYATNGVVDWVAFEHFLSKHTPALPALSDPINVQLLRGILSQTVQTLDKILIKIKLLLATLDKIFIGTLDSLAQKWLKEFAHELGNTSKGEMVTDLSDTIYALVHDELRAIHAHYKANNPALYAIIDKAPLMDVPAMCQMVDNAIQFFTADIDEVAEINDTTLHHLQNRLDMLLAQGFAEFEPYYDSEFRTLQGMKGNLVFVNHFWRLTDILGKLTKHGISAFADFDKETVKFLIEHINPETVYGGCFKKEAKGLHAWKALPLERLFILQGLYQKYQNLNAEFLSYVLAKVATNVRKNLVKTLQDNEQTSFSLNMLTLVQGLSGKKGELIARHIRHLYPVALIDEAQDVSGEQMALIERIYLSDTAKKSLFENSDKGFLLLVGDPKQAIYRFRGGDVANYHYMKSLGLDTRFSLLTNRRSNHTLIEGLNAWFGADDDGSALSVLGDEIIYQKITAVNTDNRLSWQASDRSFVPLVGQGAIGILHLPYKSELGELEAVALHINTLLQSGACIVDKGNTRPLLPSDFAVLVSTNHDVELMQSWLGKVGIGGVIEGGRSVFKSQACQDLYALFDAVQSPTEDRLGSLLVGLFGLSLAESEAVCQDDLKRGELFVYLKELQRRWLAYGLTSALMYAFLEPPFFEHPLWVQLAQFKDSERYLADMWQLFEVLPTWRVPVSQFLPHLQKKMAEDTTTAQVALPMTSGVSVMTIHKSKGLEFTIVYIVGLDRNLSQGTKTLLPTKLYPYTFNHQRRLSASQSKDGEPKFFEKLDKAEELNEKKRLGYVALTRASEQLFIVGQDKYQAITCPMRIWGLMADGKTYGVPEHLADKVSLVSLDELWQTGNLISTPYQKVGDHMMPIVYPDWQAVYPAWQFSPERTISFTSLARLFGTRFAITTHSAYDEADTPSQTVQDIDIRSGFMKGAVAGTYLHTVIELACTGQPLAEVITTTANNMGLVFDEPTVLGLNDWLTDVLTLPFLASTVSVLAVGADERASELEFTLSLKSQADLGVLSEIFREQAGIELPPLLLESGAVFGFLTGVIDLVYTHQGKYYIVDYKSNFLGDNETFYHHHAMQQAMDEHGYWLQASLYQLALHRLLRLKIANYQGREADYLGSVEYVFLRGITPHTPTLGRFVWQPPMGLILALDALFG